MEEDSLSFFPTDIPHRQTHVFSSLFFTTKPWPQSMLISFFDGTATSIVVDKAHKLSLAHYLQICLDQLCQNIHLKTQSPTPHTSPVIPMLQTMNPPLHLYTDPSATTITIV
jgi:hypothetical protein